MHVSCGYSTQPCPFWTGTLVSLPTQQTLWLVTHHTMEFPRMASDPEGISCQAMYEQQQLLGP